MSFSQDEVIGNYQIVSRLGNGVSGVVYRANQILLNAERAVKFIPVKSGQSVVKLLEEARNSHTAAEEHVVNVFNASILRRDTQHYVAIEMEYLPDGSLYTIAKRNQLSFKDTLAATRHVLCALSAAHRSGIIHCDIKPANILKSGNNFKLADFGHSYLKSSSNSFDSLIYVLHAAPELHAKASASETSDIYAVGMTLYRLTRPFNNIDINLPNLTKWRSNKLVKTFPEYNGMPDYLPNKLKTVIKKATSIDPNSRYQSAEEMMTAVERLSVNLDWKISNNMSFWEASDGSKNHKASLTAKKGKAVCQYKINGRKPRFWNNEEQTPEAARKRLNKLVKDTLLK